MTRLRSLYQQEKERERSRINAAAHRELARRHREEFEAIRRELTAATAATEANATGKRVQPPVVALGAVASTAEPSSPCASSPSDPARHIQGSRSDGSTYAKANPHAVNVGAAQTTTA
jgi:hypothetical protein